ncbi:hypothetical protein ABZ801_15935 [Actinomadura sp. NPDC047616]|uniref:hypothetical protein n=1 Tax=Actinomadura sp. NPDC047616 TaxID=3155914 RepID=UPI0033CC07CE
MTTAEMLRDAGALAVLAVLGLALAVLLLRLVALPLAGTALLLDWLAEVAARPLHAAAGGPAGTGVPR